MRKRTVSAVLIHPEERRAAVNEELRRLGEEVLLVGLRQVLHYDISYLRAVRKAPDVLRVQRVAAQRISRILEIHHAEHRPLHPETVVAPHILRQHIEDIVCKRRVLVIIDEHRVALAHHLLHERNIHGE